MVCPVHGLVIPAQETHYSPEGEQVLQRCPACGDYLTTDLLRASLTSEGLALFVLGAPLPIMSLNVIQSLADQLTSLCQDVTVGSDENDSRRVYAPGGETRSSPACLS